MKQFLINLLAYALLAVWFFAPWYVDFRNGTAENPFQFPPALVSSHE